MSDQRRPLSAIAIDIRETWQPRVHDWAEPYVTAMERLDTIDDNYFEDDAKDVVLRFLSNASTWRGEDARRIKAELRELVK